MRISLCFGCLPGRTDRKRFLEAARQGDDHAAAASLASRPDLLTSTTILQRKTALHLAAEKGHDAVMASILEKLLCQASSLGDGLLKPDVGMTGISCMSSHLDPESQVLSLINSRDADGRTPLIVACGHNNIECARLLLSNGAWREPVDLRGNSALHYASAKGYLGIMLLLLTEFLDEYTAEQLEALRSTHQVATGATVAAVAVGGVTASVTVGQSQQPQLGSFTTAEQSAATQDPTVLARQATGLPDVKRLADMRNGAGFAPLHYAVWSKQSGAVQVLLQHGADLLARNSRAGIETSIPCPSGSTPLHLAAMRGHIEISRILLKTHYERVMEPMQLAAAVSGQDPDTLARALRQVDPRAQTNAMALMPYKVAHRMGFLSLAGLLRPQIPLARMFNEEEHRTRFFGPPALKLLAAEALNRKLLAALDRAMAAATPENPEALEGVHEGSTSWQALPDQEGDGSAPASLGTAQVPPLQQSGETHPAHQQHAAPSRQISMTLATVTEEDEVATAAASLSRPSLVAMAAMVAAEARLAEDQAAVVLTSSEQQLALDLRPAGAPPPSSSSPKSVLTGPTCSTHSSASTAAAPTAAGAPLSDPGPTTAPAPAEPSGSALAPSPAPVLSVAVFDPCFTKVLSPFSAVSLAPAAGIPMASHGSSRDSDSRVAASTAAAALASSVLVDNAQASPSLRQGAPSAIDVMFPACHSPIAMTHVDSPCGSPNAPPSLSAPHVCVGAAQEDITVAHSEHSSAASGQHTLGEAGEVSPAPRGAQLAPARSAGDVFAPQVLAPMGGVQGRRPARQSRTFSGRLPTTCVALTLSGTDSEGGAAQPCTMTSLSLGVVALHRGASVTLVGASVSSQLPAGTLGPLVPYMVLDQLSGLVEDTAVAADHSGAQRRGAGHMGSCLPSRGGAESRDSQEQHECVVGHGAGGRAGGLMVLDWVSTPTSPSVRASGQGRVTSASLGGAAGAAATGGRGAGSPRPPQHSLEPADVTLSPTTRLGFSSAPRANAAVAGGTHAPVATAPAHASSSPLAAPAVSSTAAAITLSVMRSVRRSLSGLRPSLSGQLPPSTPHGTEQDATARVALTAGGVAAASGLDVAVAERTPSNAAPEGLAASCSAAAGERSSNTCGTHSLQRSTSTRGAAMARTHVTQSETDADEDECGVCLEHLALVLVQPCNHSLCGPCAHKMCSFNAQRTPHCPFCRGLISDFHPNTLVLTRRHAGQVQRA